MAQKNNIQFNIDFKKGDTTALQSLKKDLIEIQRLAGDSGFTGGMDTSDIQKMVNAARTLETALDQAFDVDLNAINVQKFNQLLKQSGMNVQTLQADLSNAGATGQQAFLKMTGQLMQFNTITKQTNHFLDNLATTFFNTLKWSAMSSIVNNISGTVQKSFYYIKDLNTALNDIRIVTNKSADDMERFAVKANEAAKALAVSTQDYTEGSLIYYQQGLDDNTVKTLTDITAKTSNVTNQSMEVVSEQLTAVWNGYQVANEAAEEGMQVYEEYVDKMAAVGATTASDLEELSTAMSKVASAASAMGVDFDDLNAQIATIVSVTRQAPESVGTALKTIYARLGDLKVDGVDEFGVKLGEITSQMETMGISILDTNGDMRAMSDVMMEVAAKWQTWTSAQRQAAAVAMAGKRQYNNLVALFDNWDMHEKALTTSMNAVGTLNEQQAIALESLANKMEIMEATAQDLYDNLFDEESLSDLIEAGTKALQLVADLSESLGGLKNILPMIGSLGLQVFNEQIGRGLATIVINAQNARKEEEEILNTQAQLQAMFSESSILQYNPQETTGALKQDLQELYSYYQDMAPYQSSMTKEQKEQYNNILQMKISAGELNAEIQEQSKYWSQSVKPLNFINQNIVEELSNTEKVDIEIQKINSVIDSLNKHIGALSGEESLDYLTNVAHQLGEETKLTEKEIERIIALIKSAYKNTENVEDAISQVVNRISQAGNKLSDLQVNQGKANSLSNSFKNVGESARQAAEQVKRFSDATKALSGLGQIASSINTLQHVNEILDNDDLSIIEKGTQALTSYGFAIPMLLNGFKALGEGISPVIKAIETHTAAINANKIAKEASMAVTEAENQVNLAANSIRSATLHGSQEEIKSAMELIKQKILKNEIITESQLAEEMENIAQEKGITLDSADYLAQQQLMIAKQGETAATIQATAAQEAYNKAKLSGISIALMAAVAFGVIGTAIIKALDAEEDRKIAIIQSRQEEQKAYEERHNAAKQEIQNNQDLAQSYIDLYSSYKNGNVEKSTMIEKTNELIDIFGEERISVANLTGDYESLNREMREYQKNQIQQKINQNDQEINEQRGNILNTIDLSYQKATELYNRVQNAGEDDKYSSLKNILVTDSNTVSGYSLDFSKVSDEFLAANAGAISSALVNSGIDISNIQPYLINIQNLLSENQSFEVEKITADKNLDNVESFEEYNKILQETIAELRKTEKYSEASQHDVTEVAIDILSNLSSNNKEYQQRAQGTNYLVDKYGENYGKIGNIADFANNLTDEELSLVLQSKVYIDSETTEKDIRNQLDIIQREASKEDLSIAVSLRAKLTSDKKLTKKELEEYAQEQGLLLQDYEIELHDFENQSNLDQVKNLNAIVDDKIAANYRYLQEVEKDAQDEVDLYEKNLAEFKRLQNQKDAYDQTHNNAIKLTEEEQKRYEELKKILEDTSDTYEHYKELLDKDNGLLLEDFDDTIFDNLISGLEGVVSEAKVLKDIAEDVGESWVIAADDIEHFGKNFPEVLAAQENYNFLQDGSIQLTKEGQQVLQETVDTYKAELIAKNKSYQLELQKQADIQKAQMDYYKNAADNLRAYLNGEKTAGEVEAAMAEDLNIFKAKLIEAEAGDNEELANIMQQDLDNVTTNARNNTSSIYEYWSSVGTIAALAGKAYEDGFSDPGLNPKGQNGPSGVIAAPTWSSKRDNTGGISDLWSISDQDIQALIDEYDKKYIEASNKYSTYISEKNGLGATVNSAINAMDNAAAGKGGKESKSSSKDKKDKEKKLLEDEFNRYFDIEKAIEAVDRQVSLLEEHQRNLHGKELIDSLKQENELIEKQTENYKKLYEAQQEEAKELGAILKGKGLEFTDDGAISNYAEATTAALAKYNAAVDAYNAGTMDDAAFEIQEKAYERFKKQLERYEELYYKEMTDTFDKIDENNRKVLDNNLKAWETEIQVQLDLNEAEREWGKFFKEIGTDFKKVFKDLRAEIKAIAAEAKTYQSDVAVDIKAINDTMAEIDKLNADQATDHTQAISQAQEKLRDLNEQLMDHASSLHQAVEDAWDAYLEGIDQAAEKFDKLNDQFDRINNQLEFQGELIELMYGEKAYDLMDKLYEGQEHAFRNQIQSVQQQLDFWKKLYNETSEGDKDHEKALEKMNELQDKLNDLTLDYIKTLKNEYGNAIDKILDDLNKKLTGGKGSDWLTEEWERVSNFSDIYFDGLEKAYHIQTLANKVEKDISKTYKENVKAQQKLAKYRDIEITRLKDIKNLRQEDLDIAEAKYDLILKEIALEESRNNKNTMKLVRNEQGNWAYQYVADEEEEDNRQQDKLDSNYNLYEIANNAYNAVINEQLKAATDYTNQMRDLQMNEAIGEEEKNARMAALRDSFIEESEIRQEKANDYFNELRVAGTALGIELYDQDETAFAGMLDDELQYLNTFITTEKTDYLSLEEAFRTNCTNMDMISRSLMENTRVDWTQSAEMLEALWNGDEDSVRVAVENAYSAMQDATQEYEDKITELEELVRMKFYGKEGEENIVNSIKMAEDETDILRDKTEVLVKSSGEMLEDLRKDLDETTKEWDSMASAIQNAINKLAAYLQMQGKSFSIPSPSVNIPEAKTDTGNVAGSASAGKSYAKTGRFSPPPNNSEEDTTRIVVNYRPGYGEIRGEEYVVENSKVNDIIEKLVTDEWAHGYYIDKDGKTTEFKTGGYTGSWNGDNGKLAVLHKKEMVLNADDTANLLNTVSIMRNLQSKALDTAYQMAAIRTQMNASSYSGGVSSVQTDTGSTFYIDRLEFPNANSVEEIKTAIMSLPNVASQYVNRNVK